MKIQARSEATRAKIIEAALISFARSGYDATGVAEICRAAEISKGAFYHHFPAKQAVFLALLERWLGDLDEQLTVLRTGARSVPEALRNMAGILPTVFKAAKGQLPLYLEFWAQASRDPAIRKAAVAPYRRYREFFADLIRAGIAEGSLRKVDPDAAAQAIVSLVIGLLLQGLVDPRHMDWEQTPKAEIQLLLGCLEKCD